jgi:putative ATP-dependent endonuclease of OLD family
MKLKSLKIDNFRAINGGGNVLFFDDNDIVFIFGKNNIGKSSILHAYQYFASPSQVALVTDFYKQDEKNAIVIEAIFIKEHLDDNNFESKGLGKWVAENGEIRFRKTWVSIGGPADKETFNPQEGRFDKGGFGGLEQILTNATPKIIYIEAMPSVKSLVEWLEKEIKSKLLKKLKENHAGEYNAALAAIQTLQAKVEGEGYLGKMGDVANKYFSKTFPELELKIRSTPHKEADLSKSFEKDFSVTIGKKTTDANANNEAQLLAAVETLRELKDGADKLDADRQFDLHGHGLIRQAIINILGIFRDSKDNVKNIILFEEPELYLHPSNKRRFRDTLYEIASQGDYQIICVSHDPQLIDLTRAHVSLARFVRQESGETAIYQAGDNLFSRDQETKERVQMLNRFNPHICETFFADEVIIVEGDTEAIVLRELLSRNYNDKDIFVLNTGTKNNIPFFIQVLRHFKIKQHIIHDSDERHVYSDKCVVNKKDGTPKMNSAWSLNSEIWDEIVASNNDGVLARRYVAIRNFEHRHNYTHDIKKGKPLSAYEYAIKIDINDPDIAIASFLRQITGETPYDIDYSQDYLNTNVFEPF